MTYFDLRFILFTDLFWQSGFFKVYYEKTWQCDKSDNRSANTTEMAFSKSYLWNKDHNIFGFLPKLLFVCTQICQYFPWLFYLLFLSL